MSEVGGAEEEEAEDAMRCSSEDVTLGAYATGPTYLR